MLALDRTTLTANLKPLERRRLVKVKVDAEDKRSRRLILTPAGEEGACGRGADLETRACEAERLLTRASPDVVRASLRELC